MNYLAHIYLSGEDELLQLGNFFADAIKGKSYLNFPEQIQNGVILHRQIDTFCDNHPIVLQSKRRLYDTHHLFSGVVVDIFYDHFLCKKFDKYATISLSQFTNRFYKMLLRNFFILPPRFKEIYPIMIAQNWLTAYADFTKLDRIFKQMATRSKFESNMEQAVESLQKNYALFEEEFDQFFPELILLIEEQHGITIQKNK